MDKISQIGSVFILPILALFSPLQHSLVAFGIIILTIYILSVIAEFKQRTPFLISFFGKTTLYKTLTVVFDSIITLVLVSLFEVYFMGVEMEDLPHRFLSLTHLALVFMASKEVKRGFELNQIITGSNIYSEFKDLIPKKVKDLLG